MAILNVTPDSFFAGSRMPDATHVERREGGRSRRRLDHRRGRLLVAPRGGRSSRRRGVAAREAGRRVPCGGWPPGGRFRSIPSAARSLPVRSKGSAPSSSTTFPPGNSTRRCPPPAKYGVPYIAMHMKGDPGPCSRSRTTNATSRPRSRPISKRETALLAAGIKRENIILDPGFGFAKTTEQNYELLAGFTASVRWGTPYWRGSRASR